MKCGAFEWVWRRDHHACAECYRRRAKAGRAALRGRALDHYGRKCVCCGETRPVFLTFDHVGGDGAQHRRENNLHGRGSRTTLLWLQRNGWPDGFRVLCFNCNTGRHINGGVCPHEEEKE